MKKLLSDIEILHNKLEHHPVYKKLSDLDSLKTFMKFHAFAVWDFMSLLKSLQREITCVEVPWRPSKYSKELVRLINEIVLGEESDLDHQNLPCDHFSLYLKAMKEVGASTEEIEQFLEKYEMHELPNEIKLFVSFNLSLALGDEPHKVAAAFFFGREKLIPDMFTGLLAYLKSDNVDCPTLIYYLERHIELDGDEHSLLAKKCLEELCGGDQVKLVEAYKVGKESLELRVKLWDGVLHELAQRSLVACS